MDESIPIKTERCHILTSRELLLGHQMSLPSGIYPFFIPGKYSPEDIHLDKTIGVYSDWINSPEGIDIYHRDVSIEELQNAFDAYYTPSKMPDSEIIKMAESAEPVE